MSAFAISLLVAAGSTAWFHSKFAKRSGGGNIKPAITRAAAVGLILFLIIFLLVDYFKEKASRLILIFVEKYC